jgi:hypothetical protein
MHDAKRCHEKDHRQGNRKIAPARGRGPRARAAHVPFVHFHYSYREISSVNGRTRICAKEKRFADGKRIGRVRGTLDGHVYDDMSPACSGSSSAGGGADEALFDVSALRARDRRK